MNERFHYRVLKDVDAATIRAFVEASPTYATFLMRGPSSDFVAFKGWFAGVVEIGTQELRALSVVQDTSANIYADSTASAQALAKGMLDANRNKAYRDPKRHQILGDAKVMADFWDVFQVIPNRTLIYDKKRHLLGAIEPAENTREKLSVTPAVPKDLRVVYELTAEFSVEQWGIDPRRVSAEAHKNYCKRVIIEGRQLVGRMGDKPVFAAEIGPAIEGKVTLDRVFVPKPLRVRKKMVAGALSEAARFALQHGEEALFFCNVDDEATLEAASNAGFASRREYRLVALRG
jgi:hypothetical protein